MTSSLGCVVNPSTNSKQYGDLFGYVCQHDSKACAGIAANASTGNYGAYSMCSADEQLSFVFNRYYQDQGRSSDACSFKGAAKLQKASSGGSSCQKLIAQAGQQGTGTVTSSPSGGGGSSSGSNGGSSSSSAAASSNIVPSVISGLSGMTAIVILAGLSGMGIVLL